MNCPHCQQPIVLAPHELKRRAGVINCPHCQATIDTFLSPPAVARTPQASTPQPSTPQPSTHATADMPVSNPFWSLLRRRFGQLLLALIVLLLSLSLGFSGIYLYKDVVTKLEPLGPRLWWLLKTVSPTVVIHTRAEDIMLREVQSTPLANQRGVRLKLVLENQAAIALALPTACISLLDVHDAPLAFRRIPLGQSVSPAQTVLAPHQTYTESIDVVPVHATVAAMLALQLNPTDTVCVEDTKTALSQ
jgi:Protein of unknown function (DUF3426)